MVPSALVGSTAGTEQALVLLLIIAAAVAVVGEAHRRPLHHRARPRRPRRRPRPALDSLRLSSDLVFYVFLPILLFESGYNLEAALLRDQWRRIAALAVPGVLVAFALTAVGVHLLGGLAWAVALLFGALIAATDPVSVVALFRKLGVSERLTDARRRREPVQRRRGRRSSSPSSSRWSSTAGPSRPAGPSARSCGCPLGGTVVGLAVGFGASWIHRRLDDHLIEITLSTIVAYGSFLLAQALGMSGVVACVTAAIILGNLGRTPHHEPRDQGDAHDGLGLRGVRRQLADLPAHRPERAPGPDPRPPRDRGDRVRRGGRRAGGHRLRLRGRRQAVRRRAAPPLAARAGLGRAQGDDRARAGAQRAGGRGRALRARDGDLRGRPAVPARTGADDTVADAQAGPRRRGAVGRRARPRGPARRLRARARGTRAARGRRRRGPRGAQRPASASSTPAR